eukprot:365775-Chlamydomonas_euryale.AAC.7
MKAIHPCYVTQLPTGWQGRHVPDLEARRLRWHRAPVCTGGYGLHRAEATGHRPQGTGRRAQGTGHRPQGTGHRAQGTGHRPQGTGHRPQATGHRAQAAGHRPQGTGHRPQGTGHRAQGTGRAYQVGAFAKLIFPFCVPTSMACYVRSTNV